MKQKSAALDLISGCLNIGRCRQEVASHCESIDALPLGWETVVDLANQHLVTPALWVALRENNYLAHVPRDFSEYLRELYTLKRKRNQKLKEQATEAVRELNRAGIQPLLIKGAAHLFRDPFDDPGSRVMVDLDILVQNRELPTAWNSLQSLGYKEVPSKIIDYDKHHHCAPLFRAGEYGAIELHREVVPYPGFLPVSWAWAEAQSWESSGLAMATLSPTHQVLLNIVHTEIVNESNRRAIIDLRYLYELAVICSNCDQAIDWSLIREVMDKQGKNRELGAYLYLAHHLLGMEIPEGIRFGLRCRGHYVRARSCLQWDWLRFVDKKVQGFAAEKHKNQEVTFAVTRGRLRYACHLFSRLPRLIGIDEGRQPLHDA